MAKLYFRYGTMNSGKSMDLLKVVHNYEEQGREVMVFKPAIDTRSPADTVASRTGLSHEAIPICDNDNMYDIVGDKLSGVSEIACVLVDEAQFLTRTHVMQLRMIADVLQVPVIAYGLRTDFRGDLFEGSKHLMSRADTIEEIKTTCCKCGRKATMNARYVDGKFTTSGETILIGGNDMYKQLCSEHYLEEVCNAEGIELPKR